MPRPKGFRARVRFLRPEEGGRTTPVVSGYRPMCDFGLTTNGRKMYNDCVLLFEGYQEVRPGETCEARILPLHPELMRGVLRPNRAFDITEGSRVVGKGEVLD